MRTASKISEAFFGYRPGTKPVFSELIFGSFLSSHAFNIRPATWPSAKDVDLFESYPYSVDGFELAPTVPALFASEGKQFFPSFLPIVTMGKTCFQYGRRTEADKNNLKKHFLDNIFNLALAKIRVDRSDT